MFSRHPVRSNIDIVNYMLFSNSLTFHVEHGDFLVMDYMFITQGTMSTILHQNTDNEMVTQLDLPQSTHIQQNVDMHEK